MYCGSLINLTFRANIEISSSNSKQSLVLWNWAQGWRSERLFLIRCIIFSLFLFFIFIPPVATRESGEIDTFDMYIVCIYIDRYGYIYKWLYNIYIYILTETKTKPSHISQAKQLLLKLWAHWVICTGEWSRPQPLLGYCLANEYNSKWTQLWGTSFYSCENATKDMARAQPILWAIGLCYVVMLPSGNTSEANAESLALCAAASRVALGSQAAMREAKWPCECGNPDENPIRYQMKQKAVKFPHAKWSTLNIYIYIYILYIW